MSAYDRVIRHPAALGSLSVLPLMQPRPRGRIRIDDARLDAETRESWERQLNRAYRACGCGEGSLGGMVGIVVGVLLAASGWRDAAFISGSTAWLVFVATFIGGAVGKIVGLLRAQGRLDALVTRIRAEWRSEPGQGGQCQFLATRSATCQSSANLRQHASRRLRFVVDLPANQLGPGWKRRVGERPRD